MTKPSKDGYANSHKDFHIVTLADILLEDDFLREDNLQRPAKLPDNTTRKPSSIEKSLSKPSSRHRFAKKNSVTRRIRNPQNSLADTEKSIVTDDKDTAPLLQPTAPALPQVSVTPNSASNHAPRQSSKLASLLQLHPKLSTASRLDPNNSNDTNKTSNALNPSDIPSVQSHDDDMEIAHDLAPIDSDTLHKTSAKVRHDPLSDERLRWLAFYHQSRREHSQHELMQKLSAKGFDEVRIKALLDEFVEKGYQSDAKVVTMVITDTLRRGQGRQQIINKLRQKGIDNVPNLDVLIHACMTDMVQRAADSQGMDMDTDVGLSNGNLADIAQPVSWLYQAQRARQKRFGDALPTTPKDKAKQLRFLLARGFEPSVCYDAIRVSIADVDGEA